MQAMFIGQDGSMGFRNGKIYNIAINVNQHVEEVVVFSNIYPTFVCPYGNINAFLKNWKPCVMEVGNG